MKTGPELVKEIGTLPTLDQFLDRNPYAVPLKNAELMEVVKIERAHRAHFNIKEQEKKDKGNG